MKEFHFDTWLHFSEARMEQKAFYKVIYFRSNDKCFLQNNE